MTLLGDTPVFFRKVGLKDLPAMVRIVPTSNRTNNEEHVADYDYQVFWDDTLRFSDNTKIDGTTKIVWDAQLTKPAPLTYPQRFKVPWPRASAFFKDEAP